MKKYYNKIIFGVVLVLAIALRFSKMLWQRDFWYDEAFTGIITRMSWQDMWWMIFHDVHPPLYYYLLKPWAGLFNYSVFGFRSFSVLFGILSVISIYWIGKKIFSEKVGLLASFFMAISPFAILYSQEARMYALLGFLMLWATYFFIQALKGNRWRYWLIWGMLATLLLATHYLALFILVIFYLVAVGYKFYNATKKKNKISANATALHNTVAFAKKFFESFLVGKKFWVATGIIVFFFALWLPVFKQHTSREGLGWVPVAYLGDIPDTLQFFFMGHQPGKTSGARANEFRQLPFSLGNESPGTLVDHYTIGLIIFLVLVLGIIFLWRQKKWRKEILIIGGISFGTLVFLILLSQIGKRFYVARYFMPVAVLIYLLLAMIVSQWRMRWQYFFIGGYLLLLLWLKPISYDTSWTDVLHNAGLVNSHTIVIADNAFEYATARFHFGEGRVKMYNRGEPGQDFSLWIIVKPEDQIVTLDNYLAEDNIIYVGAGDCNWNEYELTLVKSAGRLRICNNGNVMRVH